jgi:hypothetical protein
VLRFARSGRKEVYRQGRQTDRQIYICIYTATTLSSVLCYCEQSRSSQQPAQALYRVPPTALSSFFFSPSKYPFSSKVLLPPPPPSLPSVSVSVCLILYINKKKRTCTGGIYIISFLLFCVCCLVLLVLSFLCLFCSFSFGCLLLVSRTSVLFQHQIQSNIVRIVVLLLLLSSFLYFFLFLLFSKIVLSVGSNHHH